MTDDMPLPYPRPALMHESGMGDPLGDCSERFELCRNTVLPSRERFKRITTYLFD